MDTLSFSNVTSSSKLRPWCYGSHMAFKTSTQLPFLVMPWAPNMGDVSALIRDWLIDREQVYDLDAIKTPLVSNHKVPQIVHKTMLDRDLIHATLSPSDITSERHWQFQFIWEELVLMNYEAAVAYGKHLNWRVASAREVLALMHSDRNADAEGNVRNYNLPFWWYYDSNNSQLLEQGKAIYIICANSRRNQPYWFSVSKVAQTGAPTYLNTSEREIDDFGVPIIVFDKQLSLAKRFQNIIGNI